MTAVIERINPAVGTVQALDADTCVLTTGADTVQTLAAYLGMLDFDFDVTEPAELVDHIRRLADRYARSTPPGRQGEATLRAPRERASTSSTTGEPDGPTHSGAECR